MYTLYILPVRQPGSGPRSQKVLDWSPYFVLMWLKADTFFISGGNGEVVMNPKSVNRPLCVLLADMNVIGI